MPGINGRNWRAVTNAAPCPICKGIKWCSVAADGTLAKCMRIEAGSFKTKADKNGTPYYLHRLAGADRCDPLPPTPDASTPWADADLLHRTYTALLARLPLSKAHREALR
jgi:hypothetical protein